MGVLNFLRFVDNIRLLTPKTTPEGLVTFLSMAPMTKSGTIYDQYCTTYFYSPELRTSFGNQNYVSDLVTVFTDLHGCPDIWENNTKTRLLKTKDIEKLYNVCINFLGCSNPEWLAKGLQEDSFGGGFMGRIIFIYSDEVRKTPESAWMEVPESMQGMKITLLKDLQRIGQLKGAFNVTDEAHEFFKKLYMTYTGDFSGRMAGYYERKLTHALKIAMILSASLSNDMIITKKNITGALTLLETAEKRMPDAFMYINATREAQIAQKTIDVLKEYKGVASLKRLYSRIRHMIRNAREFDDIIEGLVESDIVHKGIYNNEKAYLLKEIARQIEDGKTIEMSEDGTITTTQKDEEDNKTKEAKS